MGWLLAGGLLGLGIVLIAGAFMIGNKKGKIDRVDGKAGPALIAGDVEAIIAQLNKYLKVNNEKALEQVIDQLGSLPREEADVIRRFLTDAGVVEKYKSRLADSAFKVRAAAAEKLGSLGGPGVSEALFYAMADKNEEVRLAATAALKNLGDPAVAALLAEALREPNKWLPARVAEVLIALGEEAVPALHKVLQDSDAIARGYAIEVLGEIGDKSSADALHQAIKDCNSNIRLRAASALGQIASAGSLQVLAETAADSEIKVRVQAVKSIGRIGGSAAAGYLGAVLSSEDDMVRYVALDALHQMGPDGLVVLRQAASSHGPARERARDILQEEGILDTAQVNIKYGE